MEKSRKELIRNTMAASTSTAICVGIMNPLDTLRVRWQILGIHGGDASKVTIFEFGKGILKNEGLIHGFYRPGVFSNMAAVAVSSGLRLGVYPFARDALVHFSDSGVKNPLHMAVAGFAVGSFSFWLATPFFQAKTIAQASKQTKAMGIDDKSNKVSVRLLVKEQGFSALFRGATPLLVRGAMFSSGAQLGYDQTKTMMKRSGMMQDGFPLHLLASVASAFISTLVSAPADRVMTQFQSAPLVKKSLNGNQQQQPIVNEKITVTGVIRQIYEKEGTRGFFRGWTPFFARVLPLMMINMPFYEFLRYCLGMEYLD